MGNITNIYFTHTYIYKYFKMESREDPRNAEIFGVSTERLLVVLRFKALQKYMIDITLDRQTAQRLPISALKIQPFGLTFESWSRMLTFVSSTRPSALPLNRSALSLPRPHLQS